MEASTVRRSTRRLPWSPLIALLLASPRLARPLAARVRSVERFRQPLGSLALLLGELLRHVDLEPVADVALALAARLRRALTSQTLDRAVPGSGRHLDLLGSV